MGQLKTAEEVWSGKELFSGERMNRGLAALGLVPGGKLAYTALKGLGKTGSKLDLLASKAVAVVHPLEGMTPQQVIARTNEIGLHTKKDI
ncbi:MAG: hypothetical protein LEGION0403_FIIPPAGN_01891 [Legionella sp.]|uniref:hypothetical protein n=1 Tax=Legionella sp. TaxID=459 RepID=UPI003D12052B